MHGAFSALRWDRVPEEARAWKGGEGVKQSVVERVSRLVLAAPIHSRSRRVVAVALLAAAELAVWWLVYATGGTTYVYLHAMYIPVTVAAVAFGAWGALAAGVAGGMLLGPLMPLNVALGTSQPVSAWVYRAGFFILTGLVVAAFSAALRRRLGQNEALRKRLAETYGRNLRLFADLVAERDEMTSGHCERVAQNAVVLGTRLGLSQHETKLLYWSGLLHDLGKIGVPEAILRKPGRLTAEEYTAMKRHARLGRDILMSVAEEFEAIADGVWSHHEHWNGGGYPRGLKGHDIPLFGCILAVVDVFEALTCDRPYREALPQDEALAIIREGVGTQFDPDVASAFLGAYADGAITIKAAPDPLYDSFVTSVLNHPQDATHVFVENLMREGA